MIESRKLVVFFLSILLFILLLYLVVSNKSKIKLLNILKTFGSIISFVSLFLVTYNNYVISKNNNIKTIIDFNNSFSNNMKNIIDILNNDSLKKLKNEVVYEKQENKLKDTVINEKEFLSILKILIIMDNLYLRLNQEEKLFNRQYDYKTYFSLLKKLFNSNKIKKYWKIEKKIFHIEFIQFVDNDVLKNNKK